MLLLLLLSDQRDRSTITFQAINGSCCAVKTLWFLEELIGLEPPLLTPCRSEAKAKP